jgi:ABC-type multidrug transport system, ATPase and permease components
VKEKKPKILKRLVPFYKPYKKVFILDLVCAFLMALSGLAFPMLVRTLLYDVLEAETFLWSRLWAIAAFMISTKAMECACRYFVITFGHFMGADIERDIRMSLFKKYMRLPTSFYDGNKVGELMSRSTTDLFDITEFAHHCPEELFLIVVRFLGIFIYLMTINIPLTLIVFAALPVFMVVAFLYNRRMRDVFRENRKKVADINSHLEDTLSGIRVVKTFTAENTEINRFERDNLDFVKIKRKSYRYMGGFFTSVTMFSSVVYILTAVTGAVFIQHGSINTADLVTYLLYVSTLLGTVDTLVQFTEQFQQGMSGFTRYCALMDTPETITDKVNALSIETFNGEIKFVNIGFAYNEEGDKVLNNLSLTVKKGENVAIVGPSGGGKTTMVNLLPRFYEASCGRILIDGFDVRDLTLKSLRDNIGVVQQDVYLFNGTVAENIAYGRLDATREEIVAAAKASGADEFISKMADGYDTAVGERGVRLSGGQKQRISIARLFLKNPPILILDEATSALDNESERLVQKSLDILAVGRTTFTIAHRLTTIKNAERILVLTENGIVEDGSHEELLKKDGVYAKLYKSYEN